MLTGKSNPVARNLRLLRKHRGISQRQLSLNANLNESAVKDIESGKSLHPRHDTLEKLANALAVSLNDLLSTQQIKPSPSSQSSLGDLVSVPELSVEVSAGGGAIVDREDERDRWYFSRNMLRHEIGVAPNQVRIITVKGDSMSGMLESQDRLLVDIQDKTPSPPGVFVLWDGLGLVVKRIEHVPNSDPARFVITAANDAYKTYELTDGEIRIVGRVVWFARRL